MLIAYVGCDMLHIIYSRWCWDFFKNSIENYVKSDRIVMHIF